MRGCKVAHLVSSDAVPLTPQAGQNVGRPLIQVADLRYLRR